jgi:hypothetical protein
VISLRQALAQLHEHDCEPSDLRTLAEGLRYGERLRELREQREKQGTLFEEGEP